MKPVKREVLTVLCPKGLRTPLRRHREPCLRLTAQCIRDQDASVVRKGNPAAVEQCVYMGCQKQPVEHVESLIIAVALGPRLDVRCAQEFRHLKSCDAALALTVVQQCRPEDVLANDLDGESFRLRELWK